MFTVVGVYMKKLGKYLLALLLAAATCFGFACGSSSGWRGTGVTDNSAVSTETLGGFVAETENYVYFINGVGVYSDDNSFGTPVKGALAAIKKSDLNNPSAAVITVPELFTAQDYDSGLYIANENGVDYVYYGTPNKNKTSSGSTAYSEMAFTKTSLDGKTTKKLFTVSSHSVDYRIAEKDGVVYIFYYDTSDGALKVYNSSNKTTEVIAKTDETTNEMKNGEYLSLSSYKFANVGNDVVVYYVMTVYNEAYYEEKAAKDGYTRSTAAYNYLYSYAAGTGEKLEKDGKEDGLTYDFYSVVGDYLFYTETDESSNEETFGAKMTDLAGSRKIVKTENIKDDMIIASLDEVYFYDSSASAIVKTTLTEDDFSIRTYVAGVSDVSDLYFLDGEDFYYRASDSYIKRIAKGDGKEDVVTVSGTAAKSSWYAPERVVVGEKTYLFYCDGSDSGMNYIRYIDLGSDVISDDDGNRIEGTEFISVMTNAEKAELLGSEISAISSPLELEEKEGVLYSAEVEKLRAKYDAADSSVKALVTESDLSVLENAEEGVKLANLFSKLEGAKKGFANMSADEKQAFKTEYKTAYDAASEKVSALKAVSADRYKAAASYVEKNYNYYYQEAVKIFTETVAED